MSVIPIKYVYTNHTQIEFMKLLLEKTPEERDMHFQHVSTTIYICNIIPNVLSPCISNILPKSGFLETRKTYTTRGSLLYSNILISPGQRASE